MSDTVLIALIAGIPSTLVAAATLLVAIKGLQKVEQVHKATNSLTDRLIEVTRAESHAAGVKEGAAEERAKNG